MTDGAWEDGPGRQVLRVVRAVRGVGAAPADSIRGWITVRRAEFLPVTGTLRALIHSGDLDLIGDPALRAALVSAADTYESNMADLRVLDRAGLDLVTDLVALRSRHSAVGSAPPDRATLEEEVVAGVDLGSLLEDEATVPLFTMAAVYGGNRALMLEHMAEANARLLELLEARLDRGEGGPP